MADNTALGRLRTTHTVTGRASSSATSYFNVSNSEAIVVGSTISVNGTSNIAGLYVVVRQKNYTDGNGNTWDIVLNWTISTSYLPVNGTFYADWDTYGLKIAKKNTNVNTCAIKDTIFDSRLRRRGTIYAQGFQSTMGTSGVNFQGNKSALGYIPLVTTVEDRKGSIEDTFDYSAGNTTETEYDWQEYRSGFQFTASTIRPINEFSWDVSDLSSYAFGRGTSPNNSVSNLSFKVLRIPCAYGYMTSTYFDNPQTTSQTHNPGSGGDRDVKGKKRIFAGKLTNSNLGYSNLRGMFVSRTGTDIDTCTEDDILMTVDDGKANTGFRGEEQKLATNYNTVITNTSVIPSISFATSVNTATSNTVSLSIFNPYTFSSTTEAALDTTAGGTGSTGGGGTGSVSVDTSLSTSGFTETYTYTLSATSGTFSLATNVEKQSLSLALF